MTPLHYRLLLALHVLSGLLHVTLALVADIRAEPHVLELGPIHGTLLMLGSGVFIGTYAATLIGLFTFQRWGRSLAVLCTVLTGIVLLMQPGTGAGSGLQTVTGFMAATTWGAVLSAMFHMPLAERFTRTAGHAPTAHAP